MAPLNVNRGNDIVPQQATGTLLDALCLTLRFLCEDLCIQPVEFLTYKKKKHPPYASKRVMCDYLCISLYVLCMSSVC